MITRRTLLSSVPTAAAGALLLSACGNDGNGTGNGNGGSSNGPDGRALSWMSMLHTPTTPDPSGSIYSALAEHTGVDFSIQWVPDASKDERINAALASNTMSDINTLNQLQMPSIRDALASGMFWDVEPFLDEFTNLSQISPDTMAMARLRGQLFGVPFQKPLARYGVVVRKDWLDALGMDVPHTLDELAAVAQAFTEEDPGGNGSTGFIDRAESFALGFRTLAGYFGAGDRFELDDSGTIVPTFSTDAWKQAMEWYRGIAANGWVNQEFTTMQKQNQIDAIAQGRGGIVVTGLFEVPNYVSLANNIDPGNSVEWALINDMTYGDVPRRIVSDTGGGMGGLLALSKDSLPEEDDVRHALGFIDRLLDEEAFALMTNGIEGTHYEIDGDGAVTITERTLWEQEVQPYSSSRPSDLVTIFKSTDDYVNLANELMAENGDYVVTNPAQPLESATYDRDWGTIQQRVEDAYNQFMVGQIDMGQYEAVVESTRSQGLDDIIAEYTQAYEDAND